MRYHIYGYVILHLTLQISQAANEQQNVAIDLSESNYGKIAFTYKLKLEAATIVVNIANVSASSRFFVIQAHSFQSNITLSKTETLDFGTYVNGTNIGLVETPLDPLVVYHYYINNVDKVNIDVLISVVTYGGDDPIPGGCNMVYNSPMAPYQIVTYDDSMVQVDTSPALDISCDDTFPQLDMYKMYLDEESLDSNAYFNAIEQLMTVDGIKKYARKVSDTISQKTLRRYYSAYHGTGTVFAIIATVENSSSAYVPAVSYACDINKWDETCLGSVSVVWKILWASIWILGLFMCLFGHRFFRTTMFIFGFLFGNFISYVLPTLATSSSWTLGFSLAFGCFYGCAWLYLWWWVGIPFVSVSIPLLSAGYVIGCAVFYIGLGQLLPFQSDLNYWGVFVAIIIVTMLSLSTTQFASFLSCSVVGATATIIANDHFVNGAVRYAIINNIRRLTVTNFRWAIIDPPYQTQDIISCSVWLLLVLLGVLVQRKQQIGKPPFPPHRAAVGIASERRPLLGTTPRIPVSNRRRRGVAE